MTALSKRIALIPGVASYRRRVQSADPEVSARGLRELADALACTNLTALRKTLNQLGWEGPSLYQPRNKAEKLARQNAGPVTSTRRRRTPDATRVRIANSARGATGAVTKVGAAAQRPLSIEAIRQETLDVMRAVPELRTWTEMAAEQGLELSILGGFAGNLVAYARHRLLQRKGAPGLREDFLEHPELENLINNAFTDIELVVTRQDGRAESADDIRRFQKRVSEKFPDFDIDVHGLKTAVDPLHPVLFDNREWIAMNHNAIDFLLVRPGAADAAGAVRDLRDLDAPLPPVLNDFAAGVIKLLPAQHGRRDPRIGGNDEELKHLLRLVIKASRYGLRLDPAQMPLLKQIADCWKPEHRTGDDELYIWSQTHVGKLIFEAFDIEATWAMLDALGLTEKLERSHTPHAKLFRDHPLPSLGKPAPQPGEHTAADLARELGVPTLKLWHDTKSPETWRAIAGTAAQKPNFLESVESPLHDGHAYYGDGAYFGTLPGASGLLIECELDPRARAGVDFVVVRDPEGGYMEWPWIVVKNRDVLRLVNPVVQGAEASVCAYLTLDSARNACTRQQLLKKLARVDWGEDLSRLAQQRALALVEESWADKPFDVVDLLGELPVTLAGDHAVAEAVLEQSRDANALVDLFLAMGPSPDTTSLITKARRKHGESMDLQLAQYLFSEGTPGGFNDVLRQLITENDSGVVSYLRYGIEPSLYPDEVALFLQGEADPDYKKVLRQQVQARLDDAAPPLPAKLRKKLERLLAT